MSYLLRVVLSVRQAVFLLIAASSLLFLGVLIPTDSATAAPPSLPSMPNAANIASEASMQEILIKYKLFGRKIQNTSSKTLDEEHAEFISVLTDIAGITLDAERPYSEVLKEMTKERLDKLLKRQNLSRTRKSKVEQFARRWLGHRPRYLLLHLRDQNAASAIEQIKAKRKEFLKQGYRITMVKPNAVFEAIASPNDRIYSVQWGLDRIQAVEAWDYSEGSGSTVIAVIDSGVDYEHPDLLGKIWTNYGESGVDASGADKSTNGIDDDLNGFIDDNKGWDFISLSTNCHPDEDCFTRDNQPLDAHGHGTHIAGIIGAATNNEIGMAGTCPNCSIMPVKALSKKRTGQSLGTAADMIAAIDYAVLNGADVINLSVASSSDVVEEEVQKALEAGVIVVAGAGNNSSSGLRYPAAYEGVISVASIDVEGQKAGNSNFGSWIDVAAPGVEIASTVPESVFGFEYSYGSGTSQATAFVSGIAGVLASMGGRLGNEHLSTIIRETVNPMPALEPQFSQGFGAASMLNAVRSLASDINQDGCVDYSDLKLILYSGHYNSGALLDLQTSSRIDLNKNGFSDTGDVVVMLQTGRYEDPDCRFILSADFNGDQCVDSADLNILGTNWLQNGDHSMGDATGDGVIDSGDLNELGQQWMFGDCQ